MLAVALDIPKCIKLVNGSSTNGVGDETVLRVQGILRYSSLPPVNAELW